MRGLLLLATLLAIAVTALATYTRARGRPWLRLLSGVVAVCAVAPLVWGAAVLVIALVVSVVATGSDFGS